MSRISVSVLVGCMLMTGSAWATPTVQITQTSGYYYGTGSEFTVTPDGELQALTNEIGPFQSFCLETTEYISMGSTYDAIVNTEAIQGGDNNGPTGPSGGDLLDPRTAYLYSNFRAGALAGYDYTPGAGRSDSAQTLQEVIWYLEDEIDSSWTAGSLQDTWYTAAQNAVNSGAWSGLGNVRVLNLYTVGHAGDPQYNKQDVLATVPVPGAIALGSLGLGLVGWFRQRRVL